MTDDEREFYGRLVRLVWMKWAKEQPAPKPSWLVPWAQLSEPDREVDRRIGEKIVEVATGGRWEEAIREARREERVACAEIARARAVTYRNASGYGLEPSAETAATEIATAIEARAQEDER